MAAEGSPFSVITDVSFVALLTSVPPKHIVLSKTADTNEDADLWRDRFLLRKTRYLCFSTDDGKQCDLKTPILVNLAMVNDGDLIPAGHRPIERTVDTGERPCKKKVLCCQYQPLASAKTAIVDIVVCSRGSRFSHSYQAVGELNSLTIMCKRVPVLERGRNSLPVHGDTSTLQVNRPSSVDQHANAIHAFATKRRGTIHPLSGIPFEINKKYLSDCPDDSETALHSICPKSMDQLEREYQYRFCVERSLLQT